MAKQIKDSTSLLEVLTNSVKKLMIHKKNTPEYQAAHAAVLVDLKKYNNSVDKDFSISISGVRALIDAANLKDRAKSNPLKDRFVKKEK